MLGLILAVVLIGGAVLIRLFRRSRAGLRLANELKSLRLTEILTGVAMTSLLFLAVMTLASVWVLWQVENAQIIAGVREPRERPTRDDDPLRVPDPPPIPTLPEFPTFPTLTTPGSPFPSTFPTLTIPDSPFPSLTHPYPSAPETTSGS